VHDFAWAADPEYKQIVRTIPNGPTIRVFYNSKPTQAGFEDLSAATRATYNNDFSRYLATWDKQWEALADAAVVVYPFIRKNFGDYPYRQYSFIHGGDGGMEYPNCTMLLNAGLGTAVHEWMHSWYQGMLGTNESKYSWMDEGFTEYATNLVEEFYRQEVSRKTLLNNPVQLRKSDSLVMNSLPLYQAPNYTAYYRLAKSGREEPLTTHADHFNTNNAYSNAAYNKGAVFLEQLGYIVGAPVRDQILLEYYRQWRFKHPNANDFLRLAERLSKLKLDWYGEYWINSTKTIDYGIDSLWESNSFTNVRLRQVGMMPMPIDLKISFKDGTSEWHYIPMYLMFGQKPPEARQTSRISYEPWKWTHPLYTIQTKRKLTDILTVEIDPSQQMADVERKNNKLELKW